MTLSEFLLARIAEQEARLDDMRRSSAVPSSPLVNKTIRVGMAGVAAQRAIVALHSVYPEPQRMVYGTIAACSTCGSVDDAPVEWPCDTIRFLAQPYDDHPDYDEEWKP